MRDASGLTTETSELTQSTAGAVTPDHGLPGFDAQSLTVTLVGVAGALFVFAAFNTLSRAATAKVRKR